MKVEQMMTRELITLEASEPLSAALTKMRENSIHSLPLIKGGKYQGLVVYRDIMRRRSIQPRAKVASFMITTAELSPDEDGLSAVQKLHSSGLPALPVTDKKKLVGILSRFDIAKYVQEISDVSGIMALEVKTVDPISVNVGDSIENAVEAMRKLDEYEVPVSDDSGKLAGVLRLESIMEMTMADRQRIQYGQYTSEKSKSKVIVSSLMDDPVSVTDRDPLSKACSEMVKLRMHIIPVVDSSQKITGVIGIDDIIDILARPAGKQGLLVTITGLGPGDEDLYDIAYGLSEKFAQKLGKMFGVKSALLNIHVIRYNTEGSTKYSVRTRLTAGKIYMSVNSYDWNFGKCVYEIFEGYEARLIKQKKR
ncbi:MAG: CBS domain-containing protein [Candidatus Thermoplasmatota archaeon]|nr:CBS domain-containing protein [Candidatus Thermoplasmatota archaeon]